MDMLDKNASCSGKNGDKGFSGNGKHVRSMAQVRVGEGRTAPCRATGQYPWKIWRVESNAFLR